MTSTAPDHQQPAPTKLTIRRSNALSGRLKVPGDKSISHRTLLLGCLADGQSRVQGFLPSNDCLATLSCVRALGVTIETGEGSKRPTALTIHGQGLHGLRPPGAPLDCVRSGTTMRLLAGILAGQSFSSVLTGDPQLLRRPMTRIVEPLRRIGAGIESVDGHAPLTIQGRGLRGLEHALPVASAQVKSAILLAGLYADGPTAIHQPGPARDHTELMLSAMGADLAISGLSVTLNPPSVPARRVEDATYEAQSPGSQARSPGKGAGSPHPSQRQTPSPDGSARSPRPSRLQATPPNRSARSPRPRGRLSPLHLTIPGDLSSASFPLVAALLVPGSRVTVEAVGVNPTRTGLLDVLRTMGADLTLRHRRDEGGEPVADITAQASPLRAAEIDGQTVVRMIDEFPLLAVAATQAHGTTLVRDAAELRVKETDRIAVIASELARMGAAIEPRPDGFAVTGPTPLRGAAVDSHGDHRIAMALAVAGLVADGQTVIQGAACIQDSFPGFTEAMQEIRADMA